MLAATLPDRLRSWLAGLEESRISYGVKTPTAVFSVVLDIDIDAGQDADMKCISDIFANTCDAFHQVQLHRDRWRSIQDHDQN